jgi:hypothetical protein
VRGRATLAVCTLGRRRRKTDALDTHDHAVLIGPRARMPGLGKNRTKPAHASIFRQASSDRRGLESVEVKRDGRKEEHE